MLGGITVAIFGVIIDESRHLSRQLFPVSQTSKEEKY
jgi:hypothetical protein